MKTLLFVLVLFWFSNYSFAQNRTYEVNRQRDNHDRFHQRFVDQSNQRRSDRMERARTLTPEEKAALEAKRKAKQAEKEAKRKAKEEARKAKKEAKRKAKEEKQK